ncbi:MAG TPA: enoyl-CoA hydratase [Pseudonocardiaceae bacterium]|nr:enoyl-CoA hydratase [Pseudonocardiaceae bacterium]
MTDDVPGLLVALEAGVLRLTLDRPDSLNSLTVAMANGLRDQIIRAEDDPDVRVVLLAGNGRGFSSGADLSGDGASSEAVQLVNNSILGLRRLGKPVVSAVHGPAAGVGVSLALAADLVIAAESAYFLLAFANVGLMPDGGSTALVTAAVGRARAMRMAMLAERLPARTAQEWGLISHVVADEGFDTELTAVLTQLAAGPPLAYARTKAAINAAALPELEAALAREASGQFELLHSKDFLEGAMAFRERRTPRFTGA